MILTIPNLIAPGRAREMAAGLAREEHVPGEATAGFTAREVKHNLEVDPDSALALACREELDQALWRHPLFSNLAMPKRITPALFSRYDVGMTYGDHIDNTIMQATSGDPIRADMSMTLFLSDPTEYDGGELVIHSDTAPIPVKLGPGEGVLYPTTDFHRVEPVRRGVRRVALFWIQSMVRDAERREILTEMWMVLDWMYKLQPPGEAPKNAAFMGLDKARANLYRMWAEV